MIHMSEHALPYDFPFAIRLLLQLTCEHTQCPFRSAAVLEIGGIVVLQSGIQ